jgi:hypothetical protein
MFIHILTNNDHIFLFILRSFEEERDNKVELLRKKVLL